MCGIIKINRFSENWIILLGNLYLLLVNVLVIGSGGREHALSWKLSQSSKVETVFTAPGNGGTENNVLIDVNDLDGLAEFAQKKASKMTDPAKIAKALDLSDC